MSGWIIDTQHDAVEHAWVDIAGIGIPVTLDRNRHDVARAWTTRDREGKRMGFAAEISLPETIPPGSYDARVIGRTKAGGGVYGATERRVTIAVPRCAPKVAAIPAEPAAFDLRIRDTQPAPPTLGRGAHTIRQESSLRVTGHVDGTERIHVIARSATNERVAWEFPCGPDGRFDAVLWTGDLERGLYDLSLCRVADDVVTEVARCGFDIAGPHYLPPMHLTAMHSPPQADLSVFGNVGALAVGGGARRNTLVAGKPIGIAGWCIDPASAMAPLAVYVHVDDKRPVPISHHLLDPRANHDPEKLRCGFGGIIDTTRLEPGAHHIRILAAAVSGSGWYVVDERDIELADHRSTATP